MGYYIGVDGGGTKTEYALFDEHKNMLVSHNGPGSNHENFDRGFDEASERLWAGLNALVTMANIQLSDVDFTLMGLAGIDHPFQYEIMCEKLRAFGLDRFDIFNDGFIVVKAGSESGAAIGYNCGTGTCCNAIDSDGTMRQLAGFGDFSGDKGNGHWVAITAFRLIYDELFLGLRKTLLKSLVFEQLSLASKEEFLGILAQLEGESSEDCIRVLINAFFAAANSGDAVVLDAVEEMAERGAALIAAHALQMNFSDDPIEVVLSGSIHTKLPSEVYVNILERKVKQRVPREFKFIKLTRPPVTGCINWIFQQYI